MKEKKGRKKIKASPKKKRQMQQGALAGEKERTKGGKWKYKDRDNITGEGITRAWKRKNKKKKKKKVK